MDDTAPVGISRVKYFHLCSYTLFTFVVICTILPIAIIAIGPICIALILYLTYKRTINIGLNKWFSLIMLIPFYNLTFSTLCLGLPENYINTKKLDWISYAIFIVYMVSFLLLNAIFLLLIIVLL